ncbi:unnamed protein product, partial [marine sediment metagenome]
MKLVAEELESAQAVIIDHEALAESFARFWENPDLGVSLSHRVRNGGILWIGFQSDGYIPNWLSHLLGGNIWSVVDPGVPDSIQVASGEVHPL